MARTVPQILQEVASLYESRNTTYAAAYKRHGEIMTLLFPDGLELKTPEDFCRFSIFNLIIGKWIRFAPTVTSEWPHLDSVDDNIVYPAMLRELLDLDRESPEDTRLEQIEELVRSGTYVGPLIQNIRKILGISEEEVLSKSGGAQ